MPSGPAIVRATIEDGRGFEPDLYSQEVHGVRSLNVVVDPHSPPSSPLKLTLRQPVRAMIVTKRTGNLRIQVLDELDVVVAQSVSDAAKKLEADLVPGKYRARTVATDGSLGAEVAFVADGQQPEIEID